MKARKVANVLDIGDLYILTLTDALTTGVDIFELSYLVYYASGLICEEVGIVLFEVGKLFEKVEKGCEIVTVPLN